MSRKYKISKQLILQVSNYELYDEAQKRNALRSAIAIKLAEAITELSKK